MLQLQVTILSFNLETILIAGTAFSTHQVRICLSDKCWIFFWWNVLYTFWRWPEQKSQILNTLKAVSDVGQQDTSPPIFILSPEVIKWANSAHVYMRCAL